MPACVVRMAGAVTAATARETRARLLDELTRDGSPVVCDVSALVAPGRASLLLLFPDVLAQAGGWPRVSLSLAAASPRLADALTAVHLERYLPVFASVDHAVRAADYEVTAAARNVRLAAAAESARRARQMLNDEWPRGRQGQEAAAFVVHELCVNAVTHVGRPFTVSWGVTPDRILVAVTDDSRQEPILRPVGRYSATSGRGMQLVSAMSQRWGVRWVYDGGKTVWADIDPTCFG